MSELIYHDKYKTKEGDLVEMKIWKVPKSKDFLEGIKYSLVFIHNGKRIFGFDNEREKGHHKHYFDMEKAYNFVSADRLKEDFKTGLEEVRRILHGN